MKCVFSQLPVFVFCLYVVKVDVWLPPHSLNVSLDSAAAH